MPVIGSELYDRLLGGAYPELRIEQLAAPTALYTRLLLQPRLDLRTGQCGTTAPKTAWGQPAGAEARCRQQRALRTQARALLRRAAEYLRTHRTEFPEYDPKRDVLNRCTTDGGLVQIR